LVPITLAIILSLLIAPLVRSLRRIGLGQTGSVLAAVLLLVISFTAVALVIGSQLVHMAQSLPQYEHTIERKLKTLNEVTVGRFEALAVQAGRLVARHGDLGASEALDEPDGAGLIPGAGQPATGPPLTAAGRRSAAAPTPVVAAVPAVVPVTPPAAPIAVELHEPPPNSLQVIERVLGSIWVPLETAGIVLVVMIFVLLEHEGVRDRFIRIAGGTDIRLTTLVINDAGERLSRFFVSQFAVNLGVGVFLWIGLTLMGLPHPLLWAGLAAVLRFVPYVGVWIAALCAVLLAAAVDPGWTLTVMTLSLFVIIEVIAGQLVEPQLYGHTTGLSPLSVVIAAIFWSWLWGPIGLIVSTPLTLCLVVAGRHIKALSALDVLLGDTQALTMPQRFYQRALSADADEIIASARVYLKRNTFANYCDVVLLPALHLARIDLESGAISDDQLIKVRGTMVAVVAAIGGVTRRWLRRPRQASVLGAPTAGRQLRLQREQISGRWQGPLVVPAGSVMVCVGLGSFADDLATELLVRILRERKIDARHMSIEDLADVTAPEAAVAAVAIVYVVSAFPSEERGRCDATSQKMRAKFPQARIVAVFLPGMLLQPDDGSVKAPGTDESAFSLTQAVQICVDSLREPAK
jgi:predicted PurR-regulated permease PerM